MAIFGSPKAKYFYPRIVYGSPAVTLDFDDPLGPQVFSVPIGQQAVAEDGTVETLHTRIEYQVQLAGMIDKAMASLVWAFWRDWAALGKSAVLTLDRFNTCQGQFEYDAFNALFTKAILILPAPYGMVRAVPHRPFYTATLRFRQGS